MRKVSVGSVDNILSVLAQSLYLLYYKRSLPTSIHDLLDVYRQHSLLLGSATNR